MIASDSLNLKCFDFAEWVTWIDENFSIIGNSIVSYANDIIIFDEEIFGTELYK